MEIPKWQKAPLSLLFSLQSPKGAPLHIYKDELFYDLCKRGLWGNSAGKHSNIQPFREDSSRYS